MNRHQRLRWSLTCWAICIVRPDTAALAEHAAVAAARNSITSGELYEHVELLADDTLEGRAAGSRGGQAAARYIETQLRELGIAPAGEEGRFTQPFYGSYRNLLAKIVGNDDEVRDEFILLGAHYDHVGYGTSQTSYGPIGYIHNGADDNASGVAVILEMLEAFVEHRVPTRRSILFAFWDGEEQGLLGSRHWVDQPTVSLPSIRLAINIDMVGRLREGRLEVGGTRTGYGLRRLFASRALADGLWLDFDWELKENSDHWPFLQRGVPVVLLHTGLHEDYHRPSDDSERVNQQGLQDVATYLFDVVQRAANADQLPRFRRAGQSESPHTRRSRERALAQLPPRLGITFRNSDEPAPVDPTPPVAESANHLDETSALQVIPGGVIVTEIRGDSPAAASDLEIGDQIMRVGDFPVVDGDSFLRIIQTQPAETELVVVRSGAEEPLQIPVQLAGDPIQLGVSWRADEAEPESVFLTRVVPGSPAAQAGLRALDRIQQIDGQAFTGLAEFGTLLTEKLDTSDSFHLTIERRGRTLEVLVSTGPLPYARENAAEPGSSDDPSS